MKWQDFYFEWLEKIGYYDWFNATLVGYKTPYPVGGRSNIGTVGFGGDGEPPIQDVPYIPTYSHPAQSLIQNQLADTGTLSSLDNSLRGYSRSFAGMFPSSTNSALTEATFGTAQKNTLRYWGYQPAGQTFSATSNFYRGYAYHTNALKQKKELRGRRGDVLIRGSKKSWFTDKKNRTYPSVRMNQKVPMVAIRHIDYSHYGDVGNLMEIAWGSMNGLSYNYNESDAITERRGDLESAEEVIRMDNLVAYEPDPSLITENMRRSRNFNPTLQANGTLNMNQPWDIDRYMVYTASQREPNAEESAKIEEINNFISQKYADNKGVIVRNKSFREVDYISDKIRYDTRQQINNLLLVVDNQMSITTAEIILQILANPTIGVNRQGELVGGPIQTIINTFMDNLIPRNTQIKIQELLMMHGPQIIPTSNGNFLNNDTQGAGATSIGSFYLGIPMNKLQFTYPLVMTSGNKTFQWTWNGSDIQVKLPQKKYESMTRGCIGYEEFFANQNTVGVARQILSLWQDLEIVDESMMDLIDSLVSYLPTIEEANYGLEKFGNLNWLYALPTWVNPNYALAIATSEIQNANSADWIPKDIGFLINGQEQYMYEIKLSDWAEGFLNQEPQITNQKYWDISMLFNQPVTKKTRGSSEREILGVHQIILDLNPSAEIMKSLSQKANKIVPNNLGMVLCNATEEQWNGEHDTGELCRITYDFFNRVVEWPYHLEFPGWETTNTPGKKGMGAMQSYLTPMDDDTDWWNQFLDDENGILTYQVDNANASQPRYEGWSMGWDFGYMDSIIQRAKSAGKPWAENLTLETFCDKVYPSEKVEVAFLPNQNYTDPDVNQNGYLTKVMFSVIAPTGTDNETIFNSKNLDNRLVFLPFQTRNVTEAKPSSHDDMRFNHLNEFGGVKHTTETETKRLLSILSNPTLGFSTELGWLNYIANEEGYLPTVQPKSLRAQLANNYFQLTNTNFRNNRLQGVTEAGGIEPLPKKVLEFRNGNSMMFQENGTMVAIPNYSPVVKSWNNEDWEGLNSATGYNNFTVGVTGNNIAMSQEIRGENYAPTFRDVAKCIINEDMPSDILEVEEMPQSFVGRNIDYTMPSGSLWKRGKIFLINWVAILTPTILRMLTPEE